MRRTSSEIGHHLPPPPLPLLPVEVGQSSRRHQQQSRGEGFGHEVEQSTNRAPVQCKSPRSRTEHHNAKATMSVRWPAARVSATRHEVDHEGTNNSGGVRTKCRVSLPNKNRAKP
uniref:Uncharacterized protein n=1 Tax=Opuntia streptacantha TaxID=393608 RepID=A0A7C8YMY3_OPUST